MHGADAAATHRASFFNREMAVAGLTQAQFRLLSLYDQPLGPTDLAATSLLESAIVSLTAQRMVQAG